MAALFFGQIGEELADSCVGGFGGGLFVETAGFELHRGGLFANAIDPEVFNKPDGGAADETFNIFALDEPDVVAEALAVEFGEAAAVIGFLLHHAAKDFGGARIVRLEGFGDVAIGAAVFFFEGDCQGEDFPLGEVFEGFGHLEGGLG